MLYEAIAIAGSGRSADSAALLVELPLDAPELGTRALARLLHARVALDSGRLGDVAPRYAAVLDVIEGSNSAELWYQCAAADVRVPACDARAAHPFRRRRAAARR